MELAEELAEPLELAEELEEALELEIPAAAQTRRCTRLREMPSRP